MLGNSINFTRSCLAATSQEIAKRCALKSLLRTTSTSTASSQVSLPAPEEAGSPRQPLPFFRTGEKSPKNHSSRNGGQFYTIDPHIHKQLFMHGGIPRMYEEQCTTFNETCIMIRNPALEIISYLKAAKYTDPVIRYVLYGNLGVGKSMSMAHILHYGHEAGFILLHVPWVPNWLRRDREMSDSLTQEGFVDLPLVAASWLVHFKTQNAALINHLDLKVQQDYVWSKRESTNKGASLLDLVELGINRVKYASDIVGVVVREIKQSSDLGRCKTLVAIDGFNGFFYPWQYTFREDKTPVTPDKVSLTAPFLEVTKLDWCNGAVVVTLDKIAVGEDRQESYLPRYLLGKKGFEHLDPFIPVLVENYTSKEIESCLSYYIDRMWITNPKGRTEDGKKELVFLSGKNPYDLMKICAPL